MTELNITHLSGFWGFVILVLDLWAIISVVNAQTGTGKKVIWVLLILFLPLLGFLIWLIAGPRSRAG